VKNCLFFSIIKIKIRINSKTEEKHDYASNLSMAGLLLRKKVSFLDFKTTIL
jgi:hypothetical protein